VDAFRSIAVISGWLIVLCVSLVGCLFFVGFSRLVRLDLYILDICLD